MEKRSKAISYQHQKGKCCKFRKLYFLKDSSGRTISTVLSDCDNREEIKPYGNHKRQRFQQFLALPNGIPAPDTISQVFTALNTFELRNCFINRLQSIALISVGRIGSIDGKRICNSGTDSKKGFIHLLSVWCSSNNLVPGRVKTEEKSNEIIALPQLPDLLVLQGAIITIDAMGCQTAIAKKIIAAEADYVLAVEGNQAFLLNNLQEVFTQTVAPPAHTTLEKGHKRIEKRICNVITDIIWLCKAPQREKGQFVIGLQTERTMLPAGEKQMEERFYIASLQPTSERFNEIIRQHWRMENKLHRSPDVTFGEDYSTKQVGNAAENFSIIIKIALNLPKNNRRKKLSLKKERFLGMSDDGFLAKTGFNEI